MCTKLFHYFTKPHILLCLKNSKYREIYMTVPCLSLSFAELVLINTIIERS